MSKLSERDVLFNEVLKTVKQYGAQMSISLVIVVLAEVQTEIDRRSKSERLFTICEKMKKRKPYKPRSL